MPGTPVLVLAWRIGPRLFGTEIATVAHIEEYLPVRRVPRPRPGIIGLAHYRERIFPMIDLSAVLAGAPEGDRTESARSLVFRIDDRMFAGRADAVVRIVATSTDAMTPWRQPPDHPAAPFVRALVAADEDNLWLVDMRRVERHVLGQRHASAGRGSG